MNQSIRPGSSTVDVLLKRLKWVATSGGDSASYLASCSIDKLNRSSIGGMESLLGRPLGFMGDSVAVPLDKTCFFHFMRRFYCASSWRNQHKIDGCLLRSIQERQRQRQRQRIWLAINYCGFFSKITSSSDDFRAQACSGSGSTMDNLVHNSCRSRFKLD